MGVGERYLHGWPVIVPFYSTGQQGKSRTVTAQRHLNLYAELTKPQDKTQLAFYGTPGTTLRTSFGDTPVRGWIAVGDFFYAVHRGTLYKVDNASTKTAMGTLNTVAGKVSMAYDGTRIVIVDGTNGYTYQVVSTTFAVITDGDFPDAAKTVTWIGGQFVVDQGTGDEFQTSPNGTDWDALDFATAESNPDGLVRVFSDTGELILGGENTHEFWALAAGADFAFTPITGATAEIGLAARWSMCKFNSGIALLAKPRGGQVQVMFIRGYQFSPISTQEIDSIINGYATVSDATAYSYMLGGHPMYQISFPTVMKTWLFDASTGMWSPLEYGLDGERHRGEMALDYLNKTIIADYENGNVYDLDPEAYTDNGTAIASEIVCRHQFHGNKRVSINQLYVDMEVGVGLTSGQGSDPQVMLQISKNNGATWGTELWQSLGAMGSYIQRVVWRRLGVSRDWLVKIRITDPVKRVFVFGDIGND